MRTARDFIDFHRRQRDWTRRIAASIPEEHIDWSPDESSFSCGDLVRHIIQAEVFWSRLLASIARGEAMDPFGLEGDAEERLQRFRGSNLGASHNEKYGATLAEILDNWSAIAEKTESTLAEIRDDALYEAEGEHPLTRFKGPLWQFMLVMLEHEAHHRGQLTAYLKVLGVEQPAAAMGV